MCASVFVWILGVAVGMCVSAIVPAILTRGYDPRGFSEVVEFAEAELNRKQECRECIGATKGTNGDASVCSTMWVQGGGCGKCGNGGSRLDPPAPKCGGYRYREDFPTRSRPMAFIGNEIRRITRVSIGFMRAGIGLGVNLTGRNCRNLISWLRSLVEKVYRGLDVTPQISWLPSLAEKVYHRLDVTPRTCVGAHCGANLILERTLNGRTRVTNRRRFNR